MNKQQAQQFRVDFQNAVKQLEQQYGAKISLGIISYDENGLTTKLSLSTSFKPSTSTKVDFMINDKVKINHRSVTPTEVFTIVKINKVSIKVKSTTSTRIINVSPDLLVKA
jgi:hypothetical protein